MTSGFGRLYLFVALVCMLFLPCCAAKPRPPRPHVILVMIDTLRASHLGCYGYERPTSPFLDSIAAESLKFEWAVSAAPWTSPAVASILTGLYPTTHGVTEHSQNKSASVLSDDFTTLPEVLKENGYFTVGYTANGWIADYLGFAQGFDVFVTRDYAPAGTVNAEFKKLFSTLDAGGRPVFLYLHYMDPHEPYQPPGGTPFEGTVGDRSYSPEEMDAINRYDGEILYLDSQLREMFSFLEEAGLYEDSILVVVSDHGEQFREYGRRGHGHTVHNAELHVPLLIRAPTLKPRSIATTVSTADVYPTMLQLLEIPDRPASQGVDLVDGLERRQAAGVLSEMTRGGSWKSLTRHDGKKVMLRFRGRWNVSAEGKLETSREVFDSRVDYWEERSLDEPLLAESLAEEFYRIYRDSQERRQGVDVELRELTEKTRAELRALGYLD